MVKSMQLRSYATPQLLVTNQLGHFSIGRMGRFSITPDTLHH